MTVNGTDLVPVVIKPDLRGNLVVKLSAAEVKVAVANLKLPASVTFYLTGVTNTGGSFAGQDDIVVIGKRCG